MLKKPWFLYDEDGVAMWPSLSINYTQKTQYIFRIAKGALDITDDDSVNMHMELKPIPFENMMVPVTKAYDAVLSRIYGDYMSFPPPEQRGKWHEGQIHFEPDIPYKEYLSKLVHDAK